MLSLCEDRVGVMIRLRMKYGDFRYEIAEEVADRHSRTSGPAPEVEEILKMMEMTGW